MEHLSPETLARLVDGAPTANEREHLSRCGRCREELDALRRQTEALGALPALRPPHDGWAGLEIRLRSEGLLTDPSREPVVVSQATETPGPTRRASRFTESTWGRSAATIAILLTGMGMGAGLSALGDGDGELASMAAGGDQPVEILALDFDGATEELSIDEVAELVRLTEEWYMASLVRYQERVHEVQGIEPPDPINRFAAIEALMAAGQAAVREAPTDPFLNGLLVNMYAERELALRGLQARHVAENWY